jgi:adenosylmethionine-8-amino-7-oxononanoate aminotransferase
MQHKGAGHIQDKELVRQFDTRFWIHPWEAMDAVGKQNRTIAGGGEGIYLFNENGDRFIDGPGGMWCTQIGYGRTEMAQAISEQVLKMPYNSPWSSTNEPAAMLAGKLAELAPGDLKHVFFTTGGSTAVDSALRFAQFYNNVLGRPQKKNIISRERAYHGSTYLSASCSGKERDKTFMDTDTVNVHFLPSVNYFHCGAGQTEEEFCQAKVDDLERKILELGPERVAAFIAEPVLASGGVIVPPTGYHRKCLEVCRRHDVLYISDEVVTGFGRLGHWFASKEVFDIEPDIITIAKGITSGYVPLGACLISDRVFSRASGEAGSGVVFSNGFTYSGHPVSCAAALKNIEIMEREHVLEHVREVAPYFQARIEELSDIPLVGEVRGVGLLGCVECVGEEPQECLDFHKAIGTRIDDHCQQMGLILRPLINMCVFSPPLIITRTQIDDMVGILERGIRRTMADLEREGIWSPEGGHGARAAS